MPNPQTYFVDINRLRLEYEKEFGQEVFITSLKNDDKGSCAGQTCAAKPAVAARAVRDGTHRLAETAEIKAFAKLQADNLQKSQAAELKKKQTVVMMAHRAPATVTPESAVAVLTGGAKK